MEESSTSAVFLAGGSFAESGTLEHDGRSYTSGGACLDLVNGVGVVYVRRVVPVPAGVPRAGSPGVVDFAARWEVTTWEGVKLAGAIVSDRWRAGFGWPYSWRRSVWFRWGGVWWRGLWCESAQDCVNVKVAACGAGRPSFLGALPEPVPGAARAPLS